MILKLQVCLDYRSQWKPLFLSSYRGLLSVSREKNHTEIDKLHRAGPLAMEPNKISILNVRYHSSIYRTRSCDEKCSICIIRFYACRYKTILKLMKQLLIAFFQTFLSKLFSFIYTEN